MLLDTYSFSFVKQVQQPRVVDVNLDAGHYSYSYRLPANVELTGGQVNDVVHVERLIAGIAASDYVIAAKCYDSEVLRYEVERYGVKPVIPCRKHS